MKKFVSILLLAALAATLLTVGAFAASTTVTIGNGNKGVEVQEGTTTATVAVTIMGNPGITSGSMKFACDLPFTIENVNFTQDADKNIKNGKILTTDDVEGDVVLVNLKIDLSNAETGKKYNVSFAGGNDFNYLYNSNGDEITDIEFVSTTITVTSGDECQHNWVENTAADGAMKSDATCTEKAVYYKSCSECGKLGTDTFESGELAEHSWENNINAENAMKSDATCTEKAVYYKSCSVCGALSDETFEYGDATGHQNTKIINKKDATCTEDGYTGDTYCNDCEKTIKSGETINAGHSWGSWVNCDENPDCNHQGRHERTCSVCPETEDEEHKWGEDGKCTKCGAKKENKPEETTPGGTTGGGNNDSNKPSDDGKKDNGTGKKDDGKKAPKTGDESNLVLWASVLLVACGAAVVVVTKKKHN